MGRLIAALIRHGDYQQLPDTPSAHQPFPLNEAGRAQALTCGERLAGLLQLRHWQLVERIDSAQMLRAWQTAELIRQQMPTAARIECFDALAERGLGCAANLSVAQIERVLADDPRYQTPPANWKADSHYRLPLQGAESLLQAGERVAAHLRSRMADLAASPVDADRLKLFVGHGAAFRHAAYHLGVLGFDDIARLSMYHATPVLLEYLSDGGWRHLTGDWKIRAAKEEALD